MPETPDRAAKVERIAAAIQGMLNEHPNGEHGNTLCRVTGARKVGDSGRLIAERIADMLEGDHA